MKNLGKILIILVVSFIINSSSIIVSPTVNNIYPNQYKINTKGNVSLKNIAVFIKFKDSNVVNNLDDEESVNNANIIYNSDELFDMETVNGIIKVPSVKKYFEKESYSSLSLTTEIFPKVNDKVVSYVDNNPIGYYLKYNEQNLIGYQNETELLERETNLVNNVINYINEEVSLKFTESELDTDNNDIIDAISFIVEGQDNLPSSIAWNDLLWSHKRTNNKVTAKLKEKRVNTYNLLYASDYKEVAGLFSLNKGTYGTIIHEFGHTLGFMDLYRYNDQLASPVGFYDVMGSIIGSNPQSFLTYFISDYNVETNWHSPINVINKTTYNITLNKPQFIDKNEQRAIKVKLDNSEEYFIIEYHEKMNTYDTHSADSSGIIVYRVNENYKYNGNSAKNKDHVYIFRPNETGLNEGKGNLKNATLNMNRRTFGKSIDINNNDFDSDTIYYTNGSNSGLRIEIKEETNDSITFNIFFPEFNGDGSKDKPYLISDVETFLYLMEQDTKNKYYKLTNDLDFKDINYPNIEFMGNLDGNNHTISNVLVNGGGLFISIGDYKNRTKIENLYIENINVSNDNKENNYLGGFANIASNVDLNNIHLKSGSINRKGNVTHDLISTGGFIGNALYDVTINNCSTNLDINASKNIGGFIGLNQNAVIKNSYAFGNITGNTNIGGFIGLQLIMNTYNVPENVFYKINNNDNLQGVGSYGYLHDLNMLAANSLSIGINKITIKDNINMSENSKLDISNIISSGNINYSIRVENEELIKYENNKLAALKDGVTNIYTDVLIGGFVKNFTTNVTIEKNIVVLTEEMVLNDLGIKKKDNFVTGFKLGTDISLIKEQLINYEGITLKGIKNYNKEEISEGLIATGMEITIEINNTDYTYVIVIKGDVNGDGLIQATDYVKIKNYIMGKTMLDKAFELAADVNNDSNIYATDYVKIKNYIMEKGSIDQNF